MWFQMCLQAGLLCSALVQRSSKEVVARFRRRCLLFSPIRVAAYGDVLLLACSFRPGGVWCFCSLADLLWRGARCVSTRLNLGATPEVALKCSFFPDLDW